MAPATNNRRAHPVLMSGQMDPEMKQKVEMTPPPRSGAWPGSVAAIAGWRRTAVLESKSFTEKEALENRLIEWIARDEEDLFRQLDGREVVRFDGRKQTLHLRARQ